MANKKNVEIKKKSAEIKNQKSNERKQNKTTQKNKLRLHSHLKVNIPLFQSLMMILPSLTKHATAEVADKPDNQTGPATAHSVTEKDVTDDHGKESSSATIHQEAQTNENHVSLSAAQTPRGSNHHLAPSHHLSTVSHPQVHYIPSVSVPTISSGGSGQPIHSNTPPTPALPVTFVPEVIKGTYGELHVEVNGQYTFVLNPNSPQYILLNQHQIGTDHFVLHLSNGSSIVVQIPIAGKQDAPSISGDLTGVVTEDHNIDSQGLLHANGKIDVIDPDQNESSVKPEVISGKYGSLTIDADGHWQYQVDNSLSTVQALTAATSLHESFTIHTKDGTPQTIDMTIGGNDDNAVITGVDAGTVTEVLTTQVQGQLSVTDSDLGEDHFQASQVTGHFGTLTITNDGAWTYNLDNSNPSVIALGKGATATDTLTVHSADGTPHQITITVNGTNNAAIITDTQTNLDARGVTEDRGYIDTHYQLHYDGQLNIQDPDTGEAQFDPNIGPQTYQGIGCDTKLGGHLLLMRDGHYTYTLDNRNIQNLAEGEVKQDSVVIRSADGTTHTIKLTVHGTNDKPTIAAQSHTVIEGGTLLHGQMVGQDIDTGAQLHYSAPQIDGLTLNTDGSYSFDPSNASYQSLASGATKTLTIPVTVTDEHNASTTQTLSITITGVNNSAVIGGVDTADINEGSAGQDMSPDYAQPGMAHLGKSPIYASGALTIADLDSSEATFDTKGIGYNYSGKYGDLLLQENGSWSYYADAGSVRGKGGYATNRGTEIDKLGEGDTVTDTITVFSKDGTSHDIVITIHGSNDRPYCASEVQLNSGKEDSAQTITTNELLANTVDVDANDAGKLTITNLHADHGSIQDNHDGTYTFTPTKDYKGNVHFTYDVKDAHGGVTHTGATTTLAAVNDNPDVTAITDRVTEDTESHHSVNLLGTATDVDGDPLTISQIQVTFEGHTGPLPVGVGIAPDGHTLIIDSHSSAFQHLSAGQKSDITVHYLVDDNHGGQTPATATITMVGSDDKAQLQSSAIDMTEGQALHTYYTMTHMNGQIGLVDPDTNDQTQFIFSHNQGGKGFGELTVWPDGRYSYSLDWARNHHANDRVAALKQGETLTDQYQVHTSDGQSKLITVTIHGEDSNARIDVQMPNVLPATQDIYEEHFVPASQTHLYAGGILKVIDPDHDDAYLQPETVNTAHHGQFKIEAGGGWSYKIDNSLDEVQNLGAGESFTETHTVHSKDGTASQLLTVTVHGTNDAPTVSSEVKLAPGVEDTDIQLTTLELLSHATDIDHNDAGHLSVANLVADHGVIIDNKDGTFTFQPAKDYNGQVHFTYDVKDALGGIAHTGASTVLSPSKDAATLEASLSASSITEDRVRASSQTELWSGWKNLDVQDADSPSEAKITHIEVNGVKHAVPANFAMNLAGTHGIFNFTHGTDGHNKWSYTADNTHTEIQGLSLGDSLTDTITLITADGTRIPLTATIQGSDDHVIIDTPDALTAALGTAIEDKTTSISGTLIAHDADSKDSVTFTAGDTTGTYGTLHVDANGQWHYDLNHTKANVLQQGETKAEGFDVTATSTDGSTATKHIEVLVQGSGDTATISVTSNPDVREDGSSTPVEMISGKLSALDPDHDQSAFSTDVGKRHDPFNSGVHGGLHISKDGSWTYTVNNSQIQQLAAGQEEHVQYLVHTIGGDYHTIDIKIVGTNDIPTVSATTLTHGTEDTHYQMQVSQFGFTDIDTGDTLHSIAITDLPPAVQGKFVLDGHDITAGQSIAAADIAKLQFIPAPDFNGDVQFKFTVNDGHADSLEATKTLHIDAVSDAATFVGDSGSIDEDTNLHHNTHVAGASTIQNALVCHGHLVISDVDGQGEAALDLKGQQNLSHAGTYGHFIIKANGSWLYTADNNSPPIQDLDTGQTLTDSIEITSKDGTKHSITVTINGTTDEPVLHSLSDSGVQHSGPIEGNLITGIGTQQGLGGAATDADSNAHLVLQDIQIKDPVSGYVTVTPGHPHTITGIGTLAIEANGHYTFTPDAGFTGKVPSMVYRVGDDGGNPIRDSSQNSLSIEITPPVQHAPTVASQTVSTNEDTTRTLATSEFGYSDQDGDALQFITISSMPSHGLLLLNGKAVTINQQISKADLDAGHLTFTPLANENGANYAQFTFTANDGHADSKQGSMTINVTSVADPATFSGDSTGQTQEDITLQASGTLIANDPDGTAGFIAVTAGVGIVGSKGYGHAHIDANGHWTYDLYNNHSKVQQLGEGQTDTETITVQSADGTQHDIVITITGTNDLPTVSEQPQAGHVVGQHSINEDSNLTSSGQITINDVDGDTTTVALDPNHSATYGHVVYDAHSRTWVYHLDNNNPSVNALNDNDTLQDKFSLLVDDGHGHKVPQEITMTINGHTDAIPHATLLNPPRISGSAGHQDLHATLGIPPLVHQGTPSLLTGWGISDGHGHSLDHLQGQYGTLHVNPATGELHYDYAASSGVIKTHSGGNYGGTNETDTFVLTLGGSQNSHVEVHLHLHSQAVHGHSGHHIDQTTLTGIDVSPISTVHPAPPPPPPVQHDEPDMASQADFTVTLGDDSYLDLTQHAHQESEQKTHHHGAAAYLDALGIKPDETSSMVHDQPADMDIVLAQVDQQDTPTHDHTHLDMSDALEHHDANVNHHQDDDAHHHHNDLDGLPDIDPNS